MALSDYEILKIAQGVIGDATTGTIHQRIEYLFDVAKLVKNEASKRSKPEYRANEEAKKRFEDLSK